MVEEVFGKAESTHSCVGQRASKAGVEKGRNAIPGVSEIATRRRLLHGEKKAKSVV